MTILYIDDDADDAEIFCEVVKRIDPEIKCLIPTNGRKAFEKLDPCPDFIFLEYRMSQFSGLEVVEQLAKSVCFKVSRIIMYSTFMSDWEIAACKRLGVHNFIRKTGHFNSLIQIIKDQLFPVDPSPAPEELTA